MPLLFGDIYFPENFNTEFAPLKDKIESLINLSRSAGNERRYSILNNKLMRICLPVHPRKARCKDGGSHKATKRKSLSGELLYPSGTGTALFSSD